MNTSNALAMMADMLDPPIPEGVYHWYCEVDGCDGEPHEGADYPHARLKQYPPGNDDWFLWFILAGRGFGKTRTGAEWLVDQMRRFPNTFWALVAPTFDDGRDTMVEGESGLLFVLDRHKILCEWNRSLGQLTLNHNNARLDLFSSQKPDSLRGPNLMGAWGDEPATWTYQQDTWDNLLLMCRKGDPKIVLTGTPRPSKFVKQLRKDADMITVGNSYENEKNLAKKWFDKVVRPLEGTRKGRQEIFAEILEDTEGALWSLGQIDHGREDPPRRLDRIVVAVDPSVSAKKGDECGIMVGGVKGEHGYLLGDFSLQAPPKKWATEVVRLYRKYKADAVVAEINNGGDLVKTVIHAVDSSVNVRTVTASRGKTTRAEPVAALYGDPSNPETWEDARIHHSMGVNFSVLEDQMTSWVQGDTDSPDRMDALVWLMTDMLRLSTKGGGRGGLRYRK